MKKSNARLILIAVGTLLLVTFAAIYAYSVFSMAGSDSTGVTQDGGPAPGSETGSVSVPFEIEVTGRVVAPQVIKPQPGGIGLKDAVLKAGGPASAVTKGEPGPDVLVLTHESLATRWYVPWSLVANESIGQVFVDGGHHIELISANELHLEIKESLPTKTPFSVAGIVENPGVFETKSPSEKFMTIMTPEYSGAAKVDGIQSNLVVLFRDSPGSSMQEVYLIPLGNPYLRPDLLRFRIRAGDHFKFTVLKELTRLPKR